MGGWRLRISALAVVAAAVCSILVLASGGRAIAADWPDSLRGSLTPSYARWDGWQFGIQAGLANMTTQPSTTNGPVFGGFLGYNVQWDELVLGFDLGYNYPSVLDASSVTTQFKLVDYGTLRGRAGYAFGQFLPYAVLGVAVGRFNFGNIVSGMASARTTPSMQVLSPVLA